MVIQTHSFNPFDPIQDTESRQVIMQDKINYGVSTHSIRYRILKEVAADGYAHHDALFQPIRSDTGY